MFSWARCVTVTQPSPAPRRFVARETAQRLRRFQQGPVEVSLHAPQGDSPSLVLAISRPLTLGCSTVRLFDSLLRMQDRAVLSLLTQPLARLPEATNR